MTKADWLDFFAAINGRTATDEEIAAALAAGEFQEDMVEEVAVETAVQETPAAPEQPQAQAEAQPAVAQTFQQSQAQPQVAQQATFVNGQPVAGPGQQVQYINGQAVVVPAQPSAFGLAFKNYWTWLVAAWRRPADTTFYGKHTGWMNYIFLSVLTTLSVFLTMRAMAGNVNRFASDLTYGLYQGTNPIGLGAFFAVLFAAFLFIFAFILGQFVTRKAIHRDPETTFVNSFDRFGRLTALALPILLLATVLSAVGMVIFPAILIYLVLILFSLANLFLIVPVKTAWNADKFYQLILASLLNGAILSVLFSISFALVGSFVSQLF